MNISLGTELLGGDQLDHARYVRQDVARRKVFYVSGFDPLGPRRYRELYRTEGPMQAAVSGYTVDVAGLPRTECGAYRWRATHHRNGLRSEAEFEFLGWDDIVRHSFRPSLVYVYALMFRTLWCYLTSGAIQSMWRLRSGPLVAGLVPAFLMMFYVLYAGLIGSSAGLIVGVGFGGPVWLAAGTGLFAGTAAMLCTRIFEEQLMIYFMVNDLGYTAAGNGRYPEVLCDRLDHFAARIHDAATSGQYDEVLVVGHSSGAQLGVSALARMIRRHGVPDGPHVGLVTLGQSIAMISFLPEADDVRADLALLADEPRVFWLDVTAPGDGACFALTDPAANCRVGGRPATALNPLVVSAAFRCTMDPALLRRNRWRFLRMHFQYLCAFAKPDAFDYFEITSGPLALATRYAGRDCSPSMLATPVSPSLHAG